MKYKIGDKVRIKTWDEMEKEYGLSENVGMIRCVNGFLKKREEVLNKNFPDRVLTIKKVFKDNYIMDKSLSPFDSWWSDDMIKGLALVLNQETEEEKEKILTYKDMLGRTIKQGGHVLHLWCKVDPNGHPEGGPSMIKHKLATVVKLNPKSIRIQYRDKRKNKESNITNTKNRIIVMKNDELRINPEDIAEEVMKEQETYKKTVRTRLKNLREDIKIFQKKVDLLQLEKKDLENTIRELTKGSDRFKLLDL